MLEPAPREQWQPNQQKRIGNDFNETLTFKYHETEAEEVVPDGWVSLFNDFDVGFEDAIFVATIEMLLRGCPLSADDARSLVHPKLDTGLKTGTVGEKAKEVTRETESISPQVATALQRPLRGRTRDRLR